MNLVEKTREELLIELRMLKNSHNSLLSIHDSNIKELNSIQTKLEKSETVNRFLSNSFFDGVAINENGKPLFTSHRFLAFLGYDAKILLDVTIEQLYCYVHEADLSNIQHSIATAYQNQIPQINLEYRIRNAQDKYIWVETIVKVEYDATGLPCWSTFAIKDITQRKLKDITYEQSEAKFRFLTEHSSDVIWHLDKNYCCDYISLADEKMRGYTQEEVIGTPLFDILKPEAVQMLQINIAKRIANEKLGLPMEVPHYELEEKCKDGGWVWVEATANPEYDENGNSIGLHGVTRNISERKKVELELQLRSEQLVAAIADKDQFMSILAHDLRGPFSSTLGFLDLLSQNLKAFDLEQVQTYINAAHVSAQRTSNLLEDLLLWGLAHSGKVPFEPELLCLQTILEDIKTILIVNANDKEISINNLVHEEVLVFADSNMLKTVLRNLVSNAIKFTHIGGAIELSAAISAHTITIAVADNGIGIKPEVLANLFSLNNIYTSKGTANESGTGLGLYLCKEFVEKHGGVIWVESPNSTTPEINGTVFSFTIPTKQ